MCRALGAEISRRFEFQCVCWRGPLRFRCVGIAFDVSADRIMEDFFLGPDSFDDYYILSFRGILLIASELILFFFQIDRDLCKFIIHSC